MPARPGDDWIAQWSRLLEQETVKVILSALIIVSVLPYENLPRIVEIPLSLLFFVLFGAELTVRFLAYRRQRRAGRTGYGEAALLFLDLVATLSFLPFDALWHQIKVLRLIRLARIFLLLRYWGPVAKEIWIILMKRRYQLLFAASLVVILAFVAGVLLANLGKGFDYDEDGEVFVPAKEGTYVKTPAGTFEEAPDGATGGYALDPDDERFSMVLWWSFRQIQDPGNLVRTPRGGLVFALSFLLTIGGVFVISFLIGIGTTVVEELVKANRSRPIGMKGHEAILNVARSSQLLIEELQNYHLKQMRHAKIAVLGQPESRPDYLFRPELRRVRYRGGAGSYLEDLQKVDAGRAHRVILLGDTEDPDSDAHVISQILSARQLNPDGLILGEIHHESNLNAAVAAGGRKTVPIPMGRFAGLFLTNIVLFPGIEDVYKELLTSSGHEIYTALFGESRIPPLDPRTARPPFSDLFAMALARGVILLGALTDASPSTESWRGRAAPLLNPDPDETFAEGLRGLVGLTASYEVLEGFATDVARGALGPAPPAPAADGDLPQFLICPESFGIRRLLICNFRESLVDFVEQMALFLGDVEIFIVVENESQADTMAELMVSHSQRIEAAGDGRAGSFKRGRGGGVEYRFHRRGAKAARIHPVVGDPSDERELLDKRVGGFSLQDVDAIVFTPEGEGASDPDAKTALGLLKIWNWQETHPDGFKPSLRIIAEVSDPGKAELLEKRARTAGPDPYRCRQFTVLSRERIRNHFLAQAIFVPYIASIYDQLLSEEKQEICRLLPDWKGFKEDREVSFPELAMALSRRSPRLLLVGVELLDPVTLTRALALNPHPGEFGFRFRLRDLVAVCAVGDTEEFERRGKRCRNCMRPRPGRAGAACGPPETT